MSNLGKLSNNTREILERCARLELSKLEEDHWIVVKHTPLGQGNMVIPLLETISTRRIEIQTAISELNHFYTEQFK